MQQQGGMHQFQAKPQSVEPRGKKYRSKHSNQWEGQDVAVSNSIMNDPRVVRGSTYAARIISQAQREDEERLHRQARMQAKRSAVRRRGGRKGGRGRAPSPEPVPGRAHMYSQTDEYLEELTDRPPEKEATTQTDALMDRPDRKSVV